MEYFQAETAIEETYSIVNCHQYKCLPRPLSPFAILENIQHLDSGFGPQPT